MPITKSAIKRVKQTKKRHARNLAYKNKARDLVKQTKKAAIAKDASVDEKLKAAISAIDKAAAKKVIHKNTAARRKSRLIKSLKAAK